MEVRNIRWVGTATENYPAMTEFAREILGLRVNFEEASTTEFVTVEGDALQVIGPGDPYFDFFGRHALGPVPLFEVTDLHAAAAELRAAGVESVGSAGVDDNWRWIHFRAPDGNLYEMASRLNAR